MLPSDIVKSRRSIKGLALPTEESSSDNLIEVFPVKRTSNIVPISNRSRFSGHFSVRSVNETSKNDMNAVEIGLSHGDNVYAETVRDSVFDYDCQSAAEVIVTSSGESKSVYRPTMFTMCSNSNSSLQEIEKIEEIKEDSECLKVSPGIQDCDERSVIMIEAVESPDDDILNTSNTLSDS